MDNEVFVRVSLTHEDAQRLIAEVQAEYVVRYGGEDATPLDPAMFELPRGAFFVAYLDGVPAATGAWRLRDDVEAFGTRHTAEVKRMYVAPGARGLGLARRMLARLEDTAAEVGAEAMILETGEHPPRQAQAARGRGDVHPLDLSRVPGAPRLDIVAEPPGAGRDGDAVAVRHEERAPRRLEHRGVEGRGVLAAVPDDVLGLDLRDQPLRVLVRQRDADEDLVVHAGPSCRSVRGRLTE